MGNNIDADTELLWLQGNTHRLAVLAAEVLAAYHRDGVLPADGRDLDLAAGPTRLALVYVRENPHRFNIHLAETGSVPPAFISLDPLRWGFEADGSRSSATAANLRLQRYSAHSVAHPGRYHADFQFSNAIAVDLDAVLLKRNPDSGG